MKKIILIISLMISLFSCKTDRAFEVDFGKIISLYNQNSSIESEYTNRYYSFLIYQDGRNNIDMDVVGSPSKYITKTMDSKGENINSIIGYIEQNNFIIIVHDVGIKNKKVKSNIKKQLTRGHINCHTKEDFGFWDPKQIHFTIDSVGGYHIGIPTETDKRIPLIDFDENSILE